MKNIYIILTQSGTILSKVIKFATAEDYNHASLCLDDKFEKLYSFGRLRPYNPLIGGFLIENAFTHVFGRFKYVPCMVIKKEVTDEQYDTICKTIKHFINHPTDYKFDIPNLFFAKTEITFPHENKFFCSAFVGHVLQTAGIEIPNTLVKMRPYQFTELNGANIIYTGELKEWCSSKCKLLKNKTALMN